MRWRQCRNIEVTAAGAVNLIGDNAHDNASYRRSYDLGGAVLALGASECRYVRIAGSGSGALSGNNGFDLDAIGLVNFVAPPALEPAAWALMAVGLGLVGGIARRRACRAG